MNYTTLFLYAISNRVSDSFVFPFVVSRKFRFPIVSVETFSCIAKMCIKHFLNTSSGKELFVYQDILEMIGGNEYTL